MNHRSKFPKAPGNGNSSGGNGKTVTGSTFFGKNRYLGISNDIRGLALFFAPRLRKLHFYLGRKYIYIYFIYIHTRIREANFSSSRTLNTQKQNRYLVTSGFWKPMIPISLDKSGNGFNQKTITKTVTPQIRVLEVAHV